MAAHAPVWTHDIIKADNGCMQGLCVFRDGRPCMTFHATRGRTGVSIVRKGMQHLFDMATDVSTELPQTELGDFLTMVHNVTRDLTSYITYNTL